MRFAILIPFAACALVSFALGADAPVPATPLIRVIVGSHFGYIVPENYANDRKADITLSIPGVMKVQGFWTPTDVEVTVADRVLRDLIHDAIKDPTILFPDLAPSADADAAAKAETSDQLERERHALADVSDNYDSYARQYVGIILDGQKLIFCNYSEGTKADPADDYIFIHRVFVDDNTVHFLQCRYDPDAKTCSNVSMIGSWPPH